MPETKKTPREAGEHFGAATQLSLEDAQQHKFRYHLLRLTLVGLTQEDIEDLGELGRLAFQESDLTDQANKIKQRAGASSLAFAIADILERAGSGEGRSKAAMLGAVLGAYTSLGGGGDRDVDVAILGAIGGAVAMSTSAFILDNINRQSWAEYLRMQD